MSNLTYKIGLDPITLEKQIEWSHYLIYRNNTALSKGCEIRLDFNIQEGKPCLHFRFRGIKLRTKDKIYIGRYLSYVELTVLKNPHRFNDEFKEVDFILLNDDLLHLKNNGFNSLHIRFNNGDTPFDADFISFSAALYSPSVYDLLSGKKSYEKSCNFRNYFELYRQALKEVGVWDGITSEARDTKEIKHLANQLGISVDIANKYFNSTHTRTDSQQEKNEYCYVYLMHDTRNGYHKIGISNKPEVREKTLQSEVPAIEMVCSKKYPSRKIAKAIEAALHNAYAEQRVRGEWFDLSALDIQMLKETLS